MAVIKYRPDGSNEWVRVEVPTDNITPADIGAPTVEEMNAAIAEAISAAIVDAIGGSY